MTEPPLLPEGEALRLGLATVALHADALAIERRAAQLAADEAHWREKLAEGRRMLDCLGLLLAGESWQDWLRHLGARMEHENAELRLRLMRAELGTEVMILAAAARGEMRGEDDHA